LWPHFAAISTRRPAWLVLHWTRRLWFESNQPGAEACFALGRALFSFSDLFQWDRFITPTIIKTFYWLVIGVICLFGLSGIFAGLTAMAISPFAGFLVVLESIAGVLVGIVFSRIAAEFILIVFRINEHLGAIRDQGNMH